MNKNTKQKISIPIIQWVALSKGLSAINFTLGAIGLTGVWISTHSWLVILFSIVGALHVALPESWIKEYQQALKKETQNL